MKTYIQIILFVVILLLGYALFESIMKPIRFNKEKKTRYEKTIERLKDIRTTQLAYKNVNGKFSDKFDELINFVKLDSFKVVRQIGSFEDSIAVAQGLVKRDTSLIGILDSLFSLDYPIDSLRFVPFTDGAEFELAAGAIRTGSGVKVKVFEAKVHNDILLGGLDRQLIVNINAAKEKLEKYPGLKVGDLEVPTNNAGNWE